MECTGNDYVFTLIIEDDVLVVNYRHERVFSNSYATSNMNLRLRKCRVDQSGTKILPFDVSVKEEELSEDNGCVEEEEPSVGKTADAVNSEYSDTDIVIDDILEALYTACSKDERTEYDIFILTVFRLWMQPIIDLIKDEDELLNELLHFILVVPQTWNVLYLPAIIEQFELSGLTRVYDVHHTIRAIHYSDAIIAYFMNPEEEAILHNGENFIICDFTDRSTDFYGYEIGKPIRGVTHMSHYDLVMYKSEFAITKDGLRQEIRNYLACDDDITDIVEYCIEAFYKLEDDESDKENDEVKADETDKELSYDVYKRIDDIRDINSFSDASRKRLGSINIKNILNHLLDTLMLPINAHCAIYHDTQIILMKNSFVDNFLFFQEIKNRLNQLLPIQWEDYADAVFCNIGATRTFQIDLMQTHHIPRIIPNKQYENMNTPQTSIIHHVHIDLQWDKSTAICYTVDDHQITHTAEIDTSTIPSINQSFIFHTPIHGSNIRDIDITAEYIVTLIKYGMKGLLQREKRVHKGIISKKKAIQLLYEKHKRLRMTWQETLKKIQERGIKQWKSIDKKASSKLFSFCIECIHLCVQQLLSLSGYDVSACQYLLSIDQAILNTFLLGYSDIRNELRDNYKKKDVIMKLVHREHISAVYCKEQLKYYEKAEDRFDYPKEIAQAHLSPEYITITYNSILSLTKDAASSNDETTIITDKVLIPFNMMETMVECMWNVVAADNSYITHCQKHTDHEYAYIDGSYDEFTACFHSYLTDNYLCNKTDINWYESIYIPLSTQCQCTLNTSRIDIHDICIIPAIEQLFTVVISSLYASFYFKTYEIDDLLVMGTLFETETSAPICMHITTVIREKFRSNQKYHKANFTWIDEDIDTVVDSAVKSVVMHPASGLCEQVASGQYRFNIPEHYFYINFDRTERNEWTSFYSFKDEWIVSSDDLFDEHKSFILDIDAKKNITIYIQYNELHQVTIHKKKPRVTDEGHYVLVLKQFMRLGSVYFSVETRSSDFAYLTSDNYYYLYEPTTLHII